MVTIMKNTKINNAEVSKKVISVPKKPFVIMRNELIANINNSIKQAQEDGIPLDAIGYVLRDFINEINTVVQQEEQRQIQAYNEELRQYTEQQLEEKEGKNNE